MNIKPNKTLGLISFGFMIGLLTAIIITIYANEGQVNYLPILVLVLIVSIFYDKWLPYNS
jgi:flagellar biosynthesis protein FliQ